MGLGIVQLQLFNKVHCQIPIATTNTDEVNMRESRDIWDTSGPITRHCLRFVIFNLSNLAFKALLPLSHAAWH